MDQTLQQTLNSFAQNSQVVSNPTFVPRAEVCESDDQVALKIEVPGLSEKDFEITLKEHILTVRGERKLENGFKQENLAWTERPYGTFVRTFNLPQTVDVNTIIATYTNGIPVVSFGREFDTLVQPNNRSHVIEGMLPYGPAGSSTSTRVPSMLARPGNQMQFAPFKSQRPSCPCPVKWSASGKSYVACTLLVPTAIPVGA
jgi:HSP20 family protein